MVEFQKFQDLELQILGIAVETSFSQKTFADSLGLPFPLLSDHPDANVARLYGTADFYKAGTDFTSVMVPGTILVLKKDRILAANSFFLVDKQGILRGRWLPGNEEAISSEHILNMARAIAGNKGG